MSIKQTGYIDGQLKSLVGEGKKRSWVIKQSKLQSILIFVLEIKLMVKE